MRRFVVFLSVFALAVLGLAPSAAAADLTATIDFEGLAPGSVITTLASGSGISGDVIAGSVAVTEDTPGARSHGAVVYDSTCGGDPLLCSGGDSDLFNPALGNTLVRSNVRDRNGDGLVDVPNDIDNPGFIAFDFSGFGPGVVTVDSIDLMDLDETPAGEIVVTIGGAAGTVLGTVVLPTTGDGATINILVGIADADYVEVSCTGSCALDNLALTIPDAPPPPPPPPPPGDGEGCTPGYWKQSHHLDSWVGYNTGDDYGATFGVVPSFTKTLLGALKQGGGGEKALGRHAVAALLNAANPDVSFAFTEADVIALVQDAYTSGDFEGAKNILEAENEEGCPLN